MTRIMRNTGLLAAAALVSGCLHVYEPRPAAGPAPAGGGGPAAAATAKPDDKGPFKPWDEVLKDSKPIDGYLKLHRKRDNTLYIEVRPDQIEKDFGLVMHISRGVGVFNIQDGLPLSDAQLMRFRRVGDKIYLLQMNPRFTADAGSPMKLAMDDNVGNSIVAAFKVESENKDTRAVLIDATPFLVSDYAALGDQLKFYYGNKPVMFDNTRSYVDRALSFPRNTEVDALLTFRANDYPLGNAAGVSDYRSVPVGVRYSFFALPEKPMQPRVFDDRVGFFTNAVRDFSKDKSFDPYTHMINRWRLEKKDPAAARSEPVNPIVYYIDTSVPREYRKYVKQAIENWNKAFEKAGYVNAIVAREAPENDTTWSAEDIRYSTVRWTPAHEMGYAIGPSETDPRTGEILNADILISSEFVTGWASQYETLGNPEALSAAIQQERLPFAQGFPARMRDRMCMMESGMMRQINLQYEALLAEGMLAPGQPMPESYLGEAMVEVIMHEVGHTLGLRHNMKASSAIPYDRLNDKPFTEQNGLTLSVMDYAPVNIAAASKSQGHYYSTEVGAYDEWAIDYGYAPVATAELAKSSATTPLALAALEVPELRKVAALAADPMHTYGTDEDTHLGPASVDPNSNTWDLGSDPVRFARDRIDLLNTIRPKLERRLIADGDGYNRLRGSVTGQIYNRYSVLAPVTKVIGGLYFARDHRGDPNGRTPFTPVTAARQREALKTIVDNAFSETAWQFEPALLNKLMPTRSVDWAGSFLVTPIDYPIHDMVNMVQTALLEDLIDGTRLTRMIDNGKRTGGDVFTVADLFDGLTSAIWSETGVGGPRAARNIDSYRRNLQRTYIDEMTRVLLNRAAMAWWTPVPEDARSLARYTLTQLSAQLGEALRAGGNLNVETRAHLSESRARIDTALQAGLVITPR
ncbi:MAG TPA: zinc-dependent metalloprotease [Longimicrobiales bacterium]